MRVARSNWNRGAIYLGILPAVLIYLVLTLGPSIATFILSFTDISGIKGVPWKFIKLDNYKEFFFQSNTRDSYSLIIRTFVFTFFVTICQNTAALFVALLLNSKLKGISFYRAVVFMPVVLGVLVSATTWNLFFTLDGPATKLLSLFGLSSNFFGDLKLAFPLVIFCQCWMYMGYSMVIFLSGLQSIPIDLYEASKIDGASQSQQFIYITLPLLWPTVTVNILLAVIGSLSAYQVILLTTGGGFDTSNLAMRVFRTAFNIGQDTTGIAGASSSTMRQGYAAAQSMVLFAIILIVTLFTQYFMNRKEKEI